MSFSPSPTIARDCGTALPRRDGSRVTRDLGRSSPCRRQARAFLTSPATAMRIRLFFILLVSAVLAVTGGVQGDEEPGPVARASSQGDQRCDERGTASPSPKSGMVVDAVQAVRS